MHLTLSAHFLLPRFLNAGRGELLSSVCTAVAQSDSGHMLPLSLPLSQVVNKCEKALIGKCKTKPERDATLHQ